MCPLLGVRIELAWTKFHYKNIQIWLVPVFFTVGKTRPLRVSEAVPVGGGFKLPSLDVNALIIKDQVK